MPNPFQYLIVYLYGTFLLWLAFVFYHYLQTGKVKWKGYRFSVGRYYLLTAFLALYPIYLAIQEQNAWLLWLYVIFGFCGMAAETLMSMWWHVFFEKRFYFYTVEPLEHKYTSGLNFIGWGSFGLFCLGLVQSLSPGHALARPVGTTITAATTGAAHLPFFWIFFLSLAMLLVLQMMVWLTFIFHKRHDHKIQKVTLGSYLFYAFPFLLPIVICALVYGPFFYTLALWLGVVSAVMEYLFGKMFQGLIGKKLWAYNPWSSDDGHFTPLAVPAFAFLGFYFWAIGLIVQGLIR